MIIMSVSRIVSYELITSRSECCLLSKLSGTQKVLSSNMWRRKFWQRWTDISKGNTASVLRSKSKPSRKLAKAGSKHALFLVWIIFWPHNGAIMLAFLARNVDGVLLDWMALHSRRYIVSWTSKEWVLRPNPSLCPRRSTLHSHRCDNLKPDTEDPVCVWNWVTSFQYMCFRGIYGSRGDSMRWFSWTHAAQNKFKLAITWWYLTHVWPCSCRNLSIDFRLLL
jgi:hypothetical protein